MKKSVKRFCNTFTLGAVCFVAGFQPVVGSTLTLSDVPLFVGKITTPNVFFEIDDSGSMDWEVLTKKYWHFCAYNSNGPGNTGNGDCGSKIDNGLFRTYNGSSFLYFEYIFNDADHAYSVGCPGSDRNAYESCSTSTAIDADWRVRSADVNVVYYDPSISYSPWPGTGLTNASFTAARSDPQSGSTGYSLTRNLSGFVFEVAMDDKGYSGTRPRRGSNVNVTNTGNGEIDLWDTHRRFTVKASEIIVEDVTYAPTSSGLNMTVTEIAGSPFSGGPYVELGDKTVAEVQQNVANWYQYARKRSYVTKGAVAAVVGLQPAFRYGLSVINSYSSLFQKVPPVGATSFGTHNSTMLENLFKLNWPASSTPLRAGLNRVGKYYETTGADKPIIDECQQNYAILFTDGYWNGSTPSGINDADGDGYSVSVADVAKYYYDKDLSTLPNNVKTNSFDQNDKQHMVTFGVSFGLSGAMDNAKDAQGWPLDVTGKRLTESSDWGDATSGSDNPEKIDDLWHAAFNSKGAYIAASTPKDVVDGLNKALGEIEGRMGSSAAAAASSTSVGSNTSIYQASFNTNWSGSLVSHPVYSGVTRTGCSGSESFGDVCIGEEWDAALVLSGQDFDSGRKIITYNPSANSGAGKGIPFRWPSNIASPDANDELTPAQIDSIIDNADPAPTVLAGLTRQDYGQAIIDYLRGDNSRVGQPTTASDNQRGFRARPVISGKPVNLGSIVHSAPAFVAAPLSGYPDTLETSAYSSFANLNKSRSQMIYVGANDGMLHGFRASDGKELIAYVPSTTYKKLPRLASENYSHQYLVDGSPSVGDVFYGTGWHTALVSGLAGGGQGVFALDVTDPTKFEESQAANLVLWEFTDADDADLGYTFSQPDIIKMNNGKWAAIFGNGYNNTEADGNASTTGHAVLYIVDIQTGTLIKKISTQAGSTSAPNGLATVTPVDIDGDLDVDYIYAGDLLGNLWKFDVKDTNSSQWKVAYGQGSPSKPLPLFTATNPNGTARPITVRPAVDFHPEPARGGLMIYFGTGKYLELVDTNKIGEPTQAFYGIWDRDEDNTDPVSNARTSGNYSKLLKQTIDIQTEGLVIPIDTDGDGTDDSTTTVDLRVTSTNSIDWDTQLGWYMDLYNPNTVVGKEEGERQVSNPVVRDGRIIFTTLIPENPCKGGGSSFLMELDSADGGRLPEPPFDLNNDGMFDSRDLHYKKDTNGNMVLTIPSGIRFGSGILSTPKVLNCKGEECKYLSNSQGGLEKINENSLGTGKLSWRQLYR